VDREEIVERVLSVVEQVPAGRVTTYGAIAEVIGGGGPRRVGNVMSAYGGPVPWWRVVRSDGRPPPCHDGEADEHYDAEGTPRTPTGRIDMPKAFWSAAQPGD
jgi:alkylated DNA nucleotide flippase Atl1